jgi:hypothetical protein
MLMMALCVLSFQMGGGMGKQLVSRYFRVQPITAFSVFNTRLYSSDSLGEKKRVVFLGTPEVAATTLRRLHEEAQKETSPYEIVSVITQPPKRRKRNGPLEPSPVGKIAEELGIPVLHPEKVRMLLANDGNIGGMISIFSPKSLNWPMVGKRS